MTNQLTISGHLGKDPIQRQTQTGKTITSVTLANTPRIKTNGEWTDGETLWVTLTVWGSLPPEFSKGSHVLATGDLITKTYTGDDGVERTGLYLNTNTLALIPRKPTENNTAQIQADPWATPTTTQTDPWATTQPTLTDETPF